MLRGIYAIVDAAQGDPLEQVTPILGAGIKLVQYRAKAGVVPAVARTLRERVHAAGGLLIVNDAVETVAFADGIHLGQEDLAAVDLAELRRSHPSAIIGISCPDAATAKAAQALGADYLGVGSVYASGSKGDAGAPIGPEGLRMVVDAVRIPVAAIGGIEAESLPEIRAAGAAMAAVIGAIARAVDRGRAAAALVAAWEAA